MPHWISFFTVLSMGTMIGLMLFVILANYRTWLGSACIGICLSFAVWSLGLYNMITHPDLEGRILWHQISAFGWSFYPMACTLFALEISGKGTRRNRIGVLLLTGLPGTLFLGLIWWNPMLYIGRFESLPVGWGMTKPGDSPVLVACVLFLAVSGAAEVFLLSRWGQHTPYRQEKKQSVRLSTTAAFALCGSTVTDLILPILDIPTPGMTPLFSMPFFIALFYSAYRYHLLDVTPVVSVTDVMRRVRDLMVVLDRNGNIQQLNLSARETLGYGIQDLQGAALSRILPGFDLPTEHAGTEVEADLMDAHGEKIPVQLEASPRYNPDGDCVGYILTAHDMRTKLALELQGVERQLDEERHQDESWLYHLALERSRLGLLVVDAAQRVKTVGAPVGMRLFGKDSVDGVDFADLFLPTASAEEKQQVRSLLDNLFRETRGWRQEALLKLLPDTLDSETGSYAIRYDFPNETQVRNVHAMLILLEDRTHIVEEEVRLAGEKERLEMVVAVLLHREAFDELLEECRSWLRLLARTRADQLQDRTAWMQDVYRNIHTFKGSFLRLGMRRTAERLMQLETTLTDILRREPTVIDVRMVMSMEGPDAWVAEDMRILQDAVGPELRERHAVVELPRSELEHVVGEVEEMMRAAGLSPDQFRGILHRFRSLYSLRAKRLLLEYEPYVRRISQERNLPSPVFAVHGMDVLLDGQRFKPFFRVLVHVFNNIIAHAIETPEERLAMAKPERSRIECHVETRKGQLLLEIADDGRGIDPDRIREEWKRRTGRQDGIALETDEAVIQHVFEPGYSSTLRADTLSGRGIGLFAVACVVRQMGGDVRVTSRSGAFTRFQFQVPVLAAVEAIPSSGRGAPDVREMSGDQGGLDNKKSTGGQGHTENRQPIEKQDRVEIRQPTGGQDGIKIRQPEDRIKAGVRVTAGERKWKG